MLSSTFYRNAASFAVGVLCTLIIYPVIESRLVDSYAPNPKKEAAALEELFTAAAFGEKLPKNRADAFRLISTRIKQLESSLWYAQAGGGDIASMLFKPENYFYIKAKRESFNSLDENDIFRLVKRTEFNAKLYRLEPTDAFLLIQLKKVDQKLWKENDHILFWKFILAISKLDDVLPPRTNSTLDNLSKRWKVVN